ncbi:ABC-2 type transport system ATP-binding protein/ribosome-dependent ATPase [Ilumatobacter fluminis]|uniref:ABC-2 type transport system ATP-binding protein/ribosome-dependent ATPase n=1 Tax=Ilumatobacter fluminis TaxID=467091 RepID=A0A4R7HXF2_9ACTN|nr:ABC transporter ATP-binding protein [Ilumatobacter fluminis]TDT15410.1 ABC-2 type transport system ATP-binding protein/ribosome-dependent ATPase [Ilumatobacter fluminis]
MSGTSLVQADAVTRRFGNFTAVDQVTMHVAPGEVVGLLGANGAGKTTLIRMLLGVLATSDGHVTLLGGHPNRQRRSRLGYVPQNLGLYRDLTVTENFDFIAGSYGVTPPPVPDELADYRDTLVGAMPLGAQRQAAFAAALAHHPELLLLDEPTSGVDALARARLWDTIRAQSDNGVGVLVSTHYMQEAQECDRLLLMSHGELVAQGTETDIIGNTTAAVVHTDNWADAFAALNAAGTAVILDGRTVRVADTTPADVEHILDTAGIHHHIEPAPATIEERMLILART